MSLEACKRPVSTTKNVCTVHTLKPMKRKFCCEICDYSTFHSGHFRDHTRTHDGSKPYKCTHGPSCTYECTVLSSLKRHTRGHIGHKPFKCAFPSCSYETNDSGSLVKHRRIHSDLRPYVCNFPACKFKSCHPANLKTHQKTHTPEGQIRHKRQERNLLNKLRAWGYAVDVEVTIRGKNGNCLDTTRYFSRLDFVIVNCITHILIVECDEDQHSWYNLSCEISRMADVHAALLLAGYMLPLHWIRYNPCGKYSVGDDIFAVKRPEREIQLREYISSVCDGAVLPVGQNSVHYMFYDRVSVTGVPCVTLDPDFPPSMRPVVTFE